jgi:hypothetical protein
VIIRLENQLPIPEEGMEQAERHIRITEEVMDDDTLAIRIELVCPGEVVDISRVEPRTRSDWARMGILVSRD